MKTRLAVCASAILSVAAGSASAVTVGYWRLDDGVAGATLTTAASQVNNATLQGTGTGGGTRVFNADVPGQFISDGLNGPIVGSNSTSLQTNGGFVDIPFSSALEPTSFTIEFFMKAGATANFPGIVTKSSTLAGRPTSWGIGKNSAEQEFYRVDTAALNNFTQAGGASTADGQWHHFALTHDASTGIFSLFRDYILIQSGNPTGDLQYDGASGLRIGGMVAGGSFQTYNGLVDEVRFSNSALTANQLLRIATIPEPASLSLLGLGGAMMLRRRRAL